MHERCQDTMEAANCYARQKGYAHLQTLYCIFVTRPGIDFCLLWLLSSVVLESANGDESAHHMHTFPATKVAKFTYSQPIY